MAQTASDVSSRTRLSSAFWRFFVGQSISNLGSSFTGFALPLVVYQLTHSAVNLAISAAADVVPYLLFGLFVGVWVDRLDRRQIMLVTNWLDATLIASIPLLSMLGLLSVWYIYLIGFLSATASIFFASAEFAALPNLVDTTNLVKANGRIQASYSAISFIGPILAGLLVVVLPVVNLLFIDAVSFAIAALLLATIQQRFNADTTRPSTSFRADLVEGLRFIVRHPVIRALTLVVALVNFFFNMVGYELVVYVKLQLRGPDWQYGWLLAANSVGIVVSGLLAEHVHVRFRFSRIVLCSLGVTGLLIVVFGFLQNIWLACVVWALVWGFVMLFNINVDSLRQVIIPDHLLGRVKTTARMLVFSLIPLGAILGGALVQLTGQVGLIFSGVGVMIFLVTVLFAFSAIGQAERYLPEKAPST